MAKRMAADGGVEAVIGKAKVLHVHQFEADREARRGVAPRKLDHSGCQVDPDDFTIGCDGLRHGVAERSRSAGEVEDAHSRTRGDPVDHGGSAMGFAPGHHFIEASLVGAGVAAEGSGVEILGGLLVQRKRAGAELPPFRIISR